MNANVENDCRVNVKSVKKYDVLESKAAIIIGGRFS